MGRDLIAVKGNNTKIIQCKNWSSEKLIHEKHIFQLYGTSILYQIENKDLYDKSYRSSLLDMLDNNYCKNLYAKKPQGIFITSTILSDIAKECAQMLNITVIENKKLKQYPCIKCNTSGKEHIYHLPYDQQYDKIKIRKSNGDMYCSTIREAEEAGFRRAYRWHGNT